MPYKLYLWLAHSISSPPMLMPHKHQPPSSRSFINTCQHLAWSSLNDMIHFISSCDLIDSSIATLLALHYCPYPSMPSPCSSFSTSCGRSKASDLPFTFATGPSKPSLVLIFYTNHMTPCHVSYAINSFNDIGELCSTSKPSPTPWVKLLTLLYHGLITFVSQH
jgi:hypothetical protein